MDYSVVIPVYNNVNGLELLFKALFDKQLFDKKTEFIFVDDGSSDNSWEKLKELKNKFSNNSIKIIRLSKNYGQHGATLCGMGASIGDWVLTMDDDLAVHPNQFQKLIDEQLKSGSQIIYGEYIKNETLYLKFLKGFYRLISKFEGVKKGRGSSFRMINGSIARTMSKEHKYFIFIDEFVLWYSEDIAFVNVNRSESSNNKSRYHLNGLISTTSKTMMYSSLLPLKAVTALGFLLASVNFLYGLFLIYRYYFDKISIMGYTSIMVAVLFSTGLIILALGLIAQYLQKLLKTINQAPVYHVLEKEEC